MEVTLLADLLVASWSVVDPRLRGPGFDSVEKNVVIGGSVSATGLREGNLDDGQVRAALRGWLAELLGRRLGFGSKNQKLITPTFAIHSNFRIIFLVDGLLAY